MYDDMFGEESSSDEEIQYLKTEPNEQDLQMNQDKSQ